MHALDLSGLRTGSTVAVMGCGPIGLLLVQLVLAAGAATVVAVDPLEHRRDAALAFRAVISLAPEDLSDRRSTVDVVGHLGVSVAFEVGGVNDAVEQGRVDTSSVVTDRFPLERVADAFVQASSRSGLKVVVQP